MIGQTTPEAWLRARLSRGPTSEYAVRKASIGQGWHPDRLAEAAENIGVIRMHGRSGTWWRLIPRTPYDGRQVLIMNAAGRLRGLREASRLRIVTEAAAAAGLGQCIHCRQFLPLEEIFEGGLGYECDPCATGA